MKNFLSLILFSGLAAFLPAQPLTTAQTEALEQLVLADIREGSPGVAVGIVWNGEIVYERYAGLADLEAKIPIDAKTRFNIASMAKQFTALCILQLVEEGKLRLTDDFRDYLPGYLPEVEAPITLGQLLNHSSGIRDVYNLWGLQGITWWEKTLNNTDALALLKQQKELNFPPGSRHLYSNSNYILLTAVIEAVTGDSFEAYSQALFERLGMPYTAFESDHEAIGPMAKPYFNFNKWFGYEWLSDIVGDGALFTTLPDQLHWEVMLQQGHSEGLSETLLSRSQSLVPGSEITSYGLGLEFGEHRGMPYRFHGGATGAWKASVIRFLEQKLTVISMTNSGASVPHHLSRDCADILLGLEKFDRQGYPTGPQTLQKEQPLIGVAGVYRTDWDYYFRFVDKGGTLLLERPGREAITLERETSNLYHQTDDPAFRQYFTRDPHKGDQVTVYYPSHDPYTLTRLAVDWEGYDFQDFNGRYRNEETGAEGRIEHSQGGIYAIEVGRDELEGQMFAPDVVLMQGYRFELVRDAAGRISHFLLYNDRLQAVRFDRIGK